MRTTPRTVRVDTAKGVGGGWFTSRAQRFLRSKATEHTDRPSRMQPPGQERIGGGLEDAVHTYKDLTGGKAVTDAPSLTL